jgi:tetratricopeptide (TPR) repeat protein
VRYSAFISYNHRDRQWATWLHRHLETYRIPDALHGRDSPVGVIGAKLPPVFQDREELASSADLAASVRVALEQAATLIVICSPNAAQSRWVNEEIRTFHALGRAAHIQCLVVDGEPHASRNPALDPALECFPPALFEHGPFEPLAADVRPDMDGKPAAKLKLIGGMLAVEYDSLRQRDAARRQKRLAWLAAASLAGFLIMSGLTVFALIQRSQAIAQRDLARQKTLTAERTVDFVKSMFVVSDPSEAKGEAITAREVLDRGARQISSSLSNEPDVKAELTATLGEVYGGLGLYKQSDTLLRQSLSIAGVGALARSQQFLALGRSQVRTTEFKSAVSSYGQALLYANRDTEGGRLIPAILVGLSEAQSSDGQYRAAENSALRAIEILGNSGGSDSAEAFEALGYNALNENRLDVAKPHFLRAIVLRSKAQGKLHPRVTENLNQLGNIAYLQNDSVVAETRYRQVLKNDEAVLGDSHPDTALTLNSLGRVMIEQRKLESAVSILEKAIGINLNQREETNFNMVFPFANLALAKRELGELGAAEPLFRKALTAARMHKHRNLAPILTDLADTVCARGRTGEALTLLAEARPIMAKTYPDDPWRIAWTDAVRGSCLLKAGQRKEGAALIRGSAKALQARWKPDSLYGYSIAQRLKALR